MFVQQKGNDLYKLIRVRKEQAKEKETSKTLSIPSLINFLGM